jgi:hypothetical protein
LRGIAADDWLLRPGFDSTTSEQVRDYRRTTAIWSALSAPPPGVPYVPKPPTPTPGVLPSNVVRELASLARVPATEQEPFQEQFSRSFALTWQRARTVSSKPGLALVKAARAATTLQQEFHRLSQQDREWVENIKYSSMAREISLEATITKLAVVFNHAIGRPSEWLALHRVFRRHQVRFTVKNQMLRELVFTLLRVARDNYGEFTLDKNLQSGTLLEALNILRPHLPKGLVPNALPIGTIQKLKTEFSRLKRL